MGVHRKNAISIDFDGVLHWYRQGWMDGSIYDPPVPGAVDAVRELVKAGFYPFVLTARVGDSGQGVAIKDWLYLHGFPTMDITNVKRPALVYIDDRGIRFDPTQPQEWLLVLNWINERFTAPNNSPPCPPY